MARAERDLEHVLRPSSWGLGWEVVAVEPDAVQLAWSRLDEGSHQVRVGGRRIDLDHPGGPGTLVVDDLVPGTELHVELRDGHGAVLARDVLRTPTAPPGERLCRIATISDLHLGRDTHHASRARRGEIPPTGSRPTSGGGTEHGVRPDAAGRLATAAPWAEDDRAFRCARAAIDDALAWGAELLVVKGDVCEESFEHPWDLAAELLADLPVPTMVLPGNHDTGALRRFEPEHGAAERGLEVIRGVAHHDMAGLRVVAVDSTRPGSSWGTVAGHGDEVAQLAADATGGTFVATHHQPQRSAVPLYWPPGIPGPDARRFARTVRSASPAVLVSSGHTHRNRRRDVAGLPWSEVASTSHFPGVWAGYTVHEGGLRQTVRRISDPDTLEWSERTRRMLGGVWALWSTGNLSDRCFDVRW